MKISFVIYKIIGNAGSRIDDKGVMLVEIFAARHIRRQFGLPPALGSAVQVVDRQR